MRTTVKYNNREEPETHLIFLLKALLSINCIVYSCTAYYAAPTCEAANIIDHPFMTSANILFKCFINLICASFVAGIFFPPLSYIVLNIVFLFVNYGLIYQQFA